MSRPREVGLYVAIASAIIGSYASYFLKYLELPFAILTCLLSLILVVNVYYFPKISNLEGTTNSVLLIVKVVVDWILATRSRLLKSKKPKISDIISSFDEGARSIEELVEADYFSMLKVGSSNPHSTRESRKRELLAKARQRIISYSDAEELQRLLEEQKREHEASGNILEAILVGLLIVFVLGVIAALFSGEE